MDDLSESDPRFARRQVLASLSDPTPFLPAQGSFRTPDPPRTALPAPLPPWSAVARFSSSRGQGSRPISGNTILCAQSRQSQAGLRLARLDLTTAESGRGREQRGSKQRRILPSEDEVKAAAAGHLGHHVSGGVAEHAAAFQRSFGGGSRSTAAGAAGGLIGGSNATNLEALRDSSDMHSQLAHLLHQNTSPIAAAAAAASEAAAIPAGNTKLHAVGLEENPVTTGQEGAGGRMEGGTPVGVMERRQLWGMGAGVLGRGMGERMEGGLGGGVGGGMGGGMSGGMNEGMGGVQGMRGGGMVGQDMTMLRRSMNQRDSSDPSNATLIPIGAGMPGMPGMPSAAAGFRRTAPGFCMPAQPLAGGSGGGLLYECRFCGKGFAQSHLGDGEAQPQLQVPD
ncbi:unnamed protein product [Closterium sp. NIES-64]|nr:unnamed protein product [Closterium sp. NIES-64]